MNRTRPAIALASALALNIGCGNEPSPVATEVAPPVTITASPAPAPVPVSPAPSDVCANGNAPVARFDIKIYLVRDKNNEQRPFDGNGPFYVGESLKFDSQGKDRFGRRTDGCTGDGPRWTWGPDALVEWNGLYGWMPSAKLVAPGVLTVAASFENGTLDFPLTIRIEEPR